MLHPRHHKAVAARLDAAVAESCVRRHRSHCPAGRELGSRDDVALA